MECMPELSWLNLLFCCRLTRNKLKSLKVAVVNVVHGVRGELRELRATH